MTDAQKVTGLLEILDMRGDTLRQRIADLQSVHRFSKQTALLLLLLWDMRGRFLTYSNIADHLEAFSGGYTYTCSGVQSVKKRLSRELEGMDWPVKIEASRGIGFRLTCIDTNWNLTTLVHEKLEIIGA